MADSTTRKLLEILEKGRPELRCASALLLGELQPKGKQILKSLGAVLQDGNPALRRASLESIGRIGGQESLPYLLQVVRQGGDESEHAALSIARIGASGVKLLLKEMEAGAPSVKKAIATALSRSGAQHAVDTALRSLLDDNPEVVDAARRSLEGEAQRGDESAKKNLAKRLIAFLSKKEVLARMTAVGAGLRVLEMLRHPAAEKMLWKWATSNYPAPIRAVALRALANLPPPQGKSMLKALLALVDEKDPSIVRPALQLLMKLQVPTAFVNRILVLLDSPEPQVRVFAMRALRRSDSVKVAEAVLGRLHHPDPEMRQAAEEVAAALPAARKIMAKQLLASKDVSQCWAITRVLRREMGGIDGATIKSLLNRAQDSVEKDAAWSEPLLHFVRRMEPQKTFDMLRKRGMQLRRSKKYAEAVRCLRLITKDPEFSSEERFELALSGLMLSPQRTDPDSRAADPCLGHFITLAHTDKFKLFDRLKKEKMLGPEEYYYLGHHFVERGDQRQMGSEFLRHSLKKWPKSKVSKEVKAKLAAIS